MNTELKTQNTQTDDYSALNAPVRSAFAVAMQALSRAGLRDVPPVERAEAQSIAVRAARVAGIIAREPLTWLALGAFVANPIFTHEVLMNKGRILEAVQSFNDSIGRLPGGDALLSFVQTFTNTPFIWESHPLVNSTRKPLVNLGLFVGGASQVLLFGLPLFKILMGGHRRENMRLGKEPLRASESPGVALVGPSELMDVVASRTIPSDAKKPLVIIHSDDNVPNEFGPGRSAKYHFTVRSDTLTSLRFMRESGLQRAEKLVLAAFDPDRGLFYGNSACGAITTSAFSTLISLLQDGESASSKVPQKIVVLLPRNVNFFSGAASITDIFKSLSPDAPFSAQSGAKVEVLHPEDIVIDNLSSEFAALAAKSSSGKLNICLIGGEHLEMLQAFRTALIERNPQIQVSIIAQDSVIVDGAKKSVPTPEAGKTLIKELLAASHRNIVYGDSDHQTTDLASLLVRAFNAEREQTVCILERPSATKDAAANKLRSLCLYDLLADRINGSVTT